MSDVDALQPGTVINERYQIEGRIGAGGYGEVLAARDLTEDRPVALKVLHGEATENDPRAVARMRQEAEVLRAIDHPNIVGLYAIDSFESGQFLVMEQVDGIGFDTLLTQQTTLDTERLLPLVRQLLSALDAAHATGILHRDLKPENILVTTDGNQESIKLVDFGVAKVGDLLNVDDPDDGITLVKTRAGSFVGTPRYSAPEVVVGDPSGPATDLFCVGLVVYEALVGRALIEGESQSELINELVFPRPFDLGDVPDPWPMWLEALLEKSPDHRTSSASAALETLDELFGSSQISISAGGDDQTTDLDADEQFPAFGDSDAVTEVDPQIRGRGAGNDQLTDIEDQNIAATVERQPPQELLDKGTQEIAATDRWEPLDLDYTVLEENRRADSSVENKDDTPRPPRKEPAPESESATEAQSSNEKVSNADETSSLDSILLFVVFALLAFVISGMLFLWWTS